jgi:hypothetical protein
LAVFGEKKAGSVVPKWKFFALSDNSVSNKVTTFYSFDGILALPCFQIMVLNEKARVVSPAILTRVTPVVPYVRVLAISSNAIK